ncbi:MAG: hypothetical protein NC390_06795 [Fusobacterium sp.]|nr:hypothetical protein [Fusobacterium sp.]
MKVEFGNVKSLGNTQKYNQQRNKENNQVAFGAKYSSDAIGKKIDSYMPWGVKKAKQLSNSLGEVQNTMINAIGTGLIAPIFIKFNPLSTSDEDTRTYAAWRQPISAVLSVLTNVYLTVKPFDKVMETAYNKGRFGEHLNRTAFQDEKFLANEIKKQHPDYSKERIDQEVKAKVKQQKDKLLNDIRNNETIQISKHQKDGLVDIDKGIFKNAVNGAIESIIDSEKTERKRLTDEKNVYRVRRREFYRTNNKQTLEYVSDMEKLLEENDLTKVKSALNDKIKGLKGTEELKLITEEILDISRGNIPKEDHKAFIDVMKEKLQKVKNTAIAYGPDKMKDKAAVEAAVKQELADRIAAIDKNLTFYEKIQQEIKNGKTVKEIEALFAEEAKGNKRLAKKGIIFAQRVADTFKQQIKGSMKCHKQIGGVILGLVAAPFSCELLNICYPVFMDKFFPNLSKGKKAKTEANDKLVEQAPAKGKEVNNG